MMENYIRIKAEVDELLKSECRYTTDQVENGHDESPEARETLISV